MSSANVRSKKRTRSASVGRVSKKSKKSSSNKSKYPKVGDALTEMIYMAPGKILADRIKVRLYYADYHRITALAAGAGGFLYNLNSAYDPNRSGGGHQPMGFDQITALYSRYTVTRCSWSGQFTNATSLVTRLVILPMNSAGPTVFNPDGLLERPGAKLYTIDGNASNSISFSGSCDIPKLMGATATQYRGDDRYSAQTNNSPTELATLCFGITEISRAAAADVYMDVKLTYDIEFFDPIDVSSS